MISGFALTVCEIGGKPGGDEVHHSIRLLPIRGEAITAGLVQLCTELHAVGALDDAALGRIKDAIAGELAEYAPRSIKKAAFLANVQCRLEKVFGTSESLGAMPRKFSAADAH